MRKYTGTLVSSPSANPPSVALPGQLVQVFLTGSTILAPLSSNPTGAPIGNPVTTDANGQYSFYVHSGVYDLADSGGNLLAVGVQIFDFLNPGEWLVSPTFQNLTVGQTLQASTALVSRGGVFTANDFSAVWIQTADTQTTKRNIGLSVQPTWTPSGTITGGMNYLVGADTFPIFAPSNVSGNTLAGLLVYSATLGAINEGTPPIIIQAYNYNANSPSITGSTGIEVGGMIIQNQGTTGFTNSYGINIEDQTGGSTNVYALRTGLGTVQFGDILNLTRFIQQYNGDVCTGNGVTSVVGKTDPGVQSAGISNTTIMTPSVDGMYLVSVYVEVTNGAGTATVGVSVLYNDDSGVGQTLTGFTGLSLSTTGNHNTSSFMVRALHTGPIQYSVTVTGTQGAATYRPFATVARLV